jgi:hypothetical protein
MTDTWHSSLDARSAKRSSSSPCGRTSGLHRTRTSRSRSSSVAVVASAAAQRASFRC